jgi:hypothetical protein
VKKLFIALSVALLALLLVASPVLAYGEATVEVVCSDIDGPDGVKTGSTVYYSGTVSIEATAEASGLVSYAEANSKAWFIVYDPDGNIAYQGSQAIYDSDAGWFYAYADASQIFDWGQDVYMSVPGTWMITQGGEASTLAFTLLPPGYSCSAAEASAEKPVSVKARILGSSYMHPFIIIEFPDKTRHFYMSDGWGEVTTDNIAFSNGGYSVEIAEGTAIQLDGKWRQYTWLEVDAQGNLTFKYNSDGHTTATGVGLSKPIKVTTS